MNSYVMAELPLLTYPLDLRNGIGWKTEELKLGGILMHQTFGSEFTKQKNRKECYTHELQKL